jgi:hypothetical protein
MSRTIPTPKRRLKRLTTLLLHDKDCSLCLFCLLLLMLLMMQLLLLLLLPQSVQLLLVA